MASRFSRIVSNSVMLFIAALFTFVFLTLLHRQSILPFDRGFYGLIRSAAAAPWNMKLRLTAWGWYVGVVWSLVYVFYFGANLLRAATATSLKAMYAQPCRSRRSSVLSNGETGQFK